MSALGKLLNKILANWTCEFASLISKNRTKAAVFQRTFYKAFVKAMKFRLSKDKNQKFI